MHSAVVETGARFEREVRPAAKRANSLANLCMSPHHELELSRGDGCCLHGRCLHGRCLHGRCLHGCCLHGRTLLRIPALLSYLPVPWISTGINFRHFRQKKFARVMPLRMGLLFFEASSLPHLGHFLRYTTRIPSWLISTAPRTAVACPFLGLGCERFVGGAAAVLDVACWSAADSAGALSTLRSPSAVAGGCADSPAASALAGGITGT